MQPQVYYLNNGSLKLIQIANRANLAFSNMMRELSGYETISTFFGDLTIADAYGLNAVKDTYKRVFKSWRNNCKMFTEFTLALNHKIWEHYGRAKKLRELGALEESNFEEGFAECYDELWRMADEWCNTNYTGEDADYYFRVTD